MQNKYLITVTTSKCKHSVVIDKAFSPLDALLQAIYDRNVDIYDDIITISIARCMDAEELQTDIFGQKEIGLVKEIIEE